MNVGTNILNDQLCVDQCQMYESIDNGANSVEGVERRRQGVIVEERALVR